MRKAALTLGIAAGALAWLAPLLAGAAVTAAPADWAAAQAQAQARGLPVLIDFTTDW